MNRRYAPFLVSGGVLLVIVVLVARLPESLVAQLHRNRPFDVAASGWVVRLLALAAVAQAFYIGYVLLRPEKVERARREDEKVARLTRDEVGANVARTAAFLSLLTLVYGGSVLALTGERGSFWFFVVVAVLQLAWYFRETGQILSWLSFQPEFGVGEPRRTPSARDEAAEEEA